VSLNFLLTDTLLFGLTFLSDLAEKEINLVPNNAPCNSAVGAASANVSVHYRKSLCLTPNTRVLEDFL
jgi:hypothetical protein